MATRDAGRAILGGVRPAAIVSHFDARFRAIGTAARAAGAKAYMKSTLRFHGVDAKQLRTEVAAFLAAHPLDHDELVAGVDALFASEAFDLRSAAIALMEQRWELLDPSDLHWLVELARTAACWAHVDFLVTSVIEYVLERHVADDDAAELITGWASDADSCWVRRTGLLAQLRRLRQGRGDWALFEAIAVPLLGEKEFFIRKAIGWVLREVSKQRPELVRAFVARYGDTMSGVTRREATKYLGAKQ